MKEKKQRIKLKDRTLENDIKYRGFLSYRHLRILGWFFLAVSQVAILLKILAKLDPYSAPIANTVSSALTIFSAFPLPLFMLANFAIILQKRNHFKSLLLVNGILALVIYLVANLCVLHYGLGLAQAFDPEMDFRSFSMFMGKLLWAVNQTTLSFNMFIDLVLCSLVFFFLVYKPKKHFQGKKIAFFRLMVIFPIMYEVACIVIKYMMASNSLTVPFYVFFLLTSKPPFTFVAFVFVVIIIKIGEMSHLKRHDSEELYLEHIKTNAHSFKISLHTSVVFLICAVLDLLVLMGFVVVSYLNTGDAEIIEQTLYGCVNAGIGRSIGLILIVPIILLFSYSKTYKSTKLDPFIPIGGIGFIAFIYFEGIFLVISQNIPILIENLNNMTAAL